MTRTGRPNRIAIRPKTSSSTDQRIRFAGDDPVVTSVPPEPDPDPDPALEPTSVVAVSTDVVVASTVVVVPPGFVVVVPPGFVVVVPPGFVVVVVGVTPPAVDHVMPEAGEANVKTTFQ
jgi:hypothetical protein